MSWWGKVIGGAFGFMLGGPLGVLLGAAVGHQFDKGLAEPILGGGAAGDQERVQTAFFTAAFSVMGHVAKADGRVSEDEIEMARALMREMSLDARQSRVAIDLFNMGKQDGFDVDEVTAQFKRECHRRRTLLQMFMEIQLHAAYADGVLHPAEESLLRRLATQLGFSAAHFDQLEAMVRAQSAFSASAAGGPGRRASKTLIADGYRILGVPASASDVEIKKAYRRLMSQHHPDKLISKGLPEEMMKLATEKTQEIKAAYETVKEARARHAA
jgi:DnaJ like chaperone protein